MCDKILFPNISQGFGHITFAEQITTCSGLELDELTEYAWKQEVLIDEGSGLAGVE